LISKIVLTLTFIIALPTQKKESDQGLQPAIRKGGFPNPPLQPHLRTTGFYRVSFHGILALDVGRSILIAIVSSPHSDAAMTCGRK
jgi:hypothetical protein